MCRKSVNSQYNLLIWLIETREPKLYEHIFSRVQNKVLINDIRLQAATILDEYWAELHDNNMDKDFLYKSNFDQE